MTRGEPGLHPLRARLRSSRAVRRPPSPAVACCRSSCAAATAPGLPPRCCEPRRCSPGVDCRRRPPSRYSRQFKRPIRPPPETLADHASPARRIRPSSPCCTPPARMSPSRPGPRPRVRSRPFPSRRLQRGLPLAHSPRGSRGRSLIGTRRRALEEARTPLSPCAPVSPTPFPGSVAGRGRRIDADSGGSPSTTPVSSGWPAIRRPNHRRASEDEPW